MAPCHSCFERKTITVLYKNPITKETVEKEMVTNDYLCLLCKNTIDPDKSVITIVKGGNTTNLWKHLREKHIQTHDKLKGKGDQDPAPLSSPSSKVSSTTKDAGQLGKDDVLEQTTSRRGPPPPKKVRVDGEIGKYMYTLPSDGPSTSASVPSTLALRACTEKQDRLVALLMDHFVTSESANLKDMDNETFKKILFAKLPSHFDSPGKARSLIVKRENVLRAALKLKIMAATGIALCIREVQSEDFDDYVVVNVRFIDAESPVLATLSIRKLESLLSANYEELLYGVLNEWGLEAKRVCSVVVPCQSDYYFEAAKHVFPSAAIFTCIRELVSEMITEFLDNLDKLPIIANKIIDVYNFLLSEHTVNSKLEENDRQSLIQCQGLIDKINFICDATWRIGAVTSKYAGPRTIVEGQFILSNAEKDALQEISNLSSKFLKTLRCMKNQKCLPASQFPTACAGLKCRLGEYAEKAAQCDSDFGQLFRNLILNTGKLKSHNQIAIGIAAVLDPRMKGGSQIDAVIKSKVYKVISDELRMNGTTDEVEESETDEATSDNEQITMLTLYSQYNKEGSKAYSSSGMNLALKAYLESAKTRADTSGCLACVWKDKAGHPLYNVAMKYSSAVYGSFGCNSIKICSLDMSRADKEKWRNTAVFVRHVPSDIL